MVDIFGGEKKFGRILILAYASNTIFFAVNTLFIVILVTWKYFLSFAYYFHSSHFIKYTFSVDLIVDIVRMLLQFDQLKNSHAIQVSS